MMKDQLTEWYDEGREQGHRWLEIGYDLWERSFDKIYHKGDQHPERTKLTSFDGVGFIDLDKPLVT
jgi:hypothetical protein